MSNRDNWSRIDPYLCGIDGYEEKSEPNAEYNNDVLSLFEVWMNEIGNHERELLRSRMKKRRTPRT